MTPNQDTPNLSKSRLLTAWQCLKYIHLKQNQPDDARPPPGIEAVFAIGHRVGEIAKRLYGNERAVEIPYDAENLDAAVRETRALIEQGADFPIFEATFEHDGVLVRVDVLLPDGDGWRAVEIKASTSVKDVHVIDCAIQLWVMRGAGLPVTSIALGYVDNQFVYAGDDNYDGLLIEEDLTAQSAALEPAVIDLVRNAREAITGERPELPVGTHCDQPYECHYRHVCWPLSAEFPVTGLKGRKARLADWVNAGHRDIRDVPAADITAALQRRIHRVTSAGSPEVLDGARQALNALDYPRYFLDFETVGPAVPFWAGTRPYQAVPVQYSVHVDDGSGDGAYQGMQHHEFLDLSGAAPMRALAERLIEDLGNTGPVLMYTTYEKTVIETLIGLFPDLSGPLQAIIERLYDMKPVVKDHYYHPQMLGSWSIKAVLPALAPHLDYSNLDGISEGMGASEGFLEAIDPATTPARKTELEEQLLRYCRFDTEAMVEIVRFFTR